MHHLPINEHCRQPESWYRGFMPQLLRRLVLPDGSILRAQLPGRPTRDSLFNDPLRDNKSLLKVRTLKCVTLGMVGMFPLLVRP